VIRSIALALAAAALVAAAPTPVPPGPVLAGPGYQPLDKDERGLWMEVEEQERQLRMSNFVMHDPALNAYVHGVFCRLTGEAQCTATRIYIMRTPYFNAQMAPNGMMLVWSGLFLRTQNEAQLAAVLGHEFTHYQHRHSLQNFRSLRSKASAAAFLGLLPGGLLIQLGILQSIFAYSREMESDADAGSIPLMVKAGYDPREASKIWEQIRAEADATAVARNKASRKDKDGGMFATHPASAERMATLRALADRQAAAEPAETGRDRYRAGLAPYWAMFIDDQIKLNDFGATDYLLTNLAREGWTPELLYARGELYRTRGSTPDLKAAADFYRQATLSPDAPIESWRGLGLALLRSGATTEGQGALHQYLAKRPEASDRAILASMAGET
jgi:hypothetical protein